METNDYINLLRKINQLKEARYTEAEKQRDYGIDQSKLKPWQYVAGGDIHDRPGGEEAWNKEQEKAREVVRPKAKKETEEERKKRLELEAEERQRDIDNQEEYRGER